MRNDSNETSDQAGRWATRPQWVTQFYFDRPWLLRDGDVYEAIAPLVEEASGPADAAIAIAGWQAMTLGPLPVRLEKLREHAGMLDRGELSARAAERLRQAITADRDAYGYTSVSRRPFVWLDGRRFSADEYNAWCEREALGADAPPVVLWLHQTVGIYGVDPAGREWSTFSGPPVVCDVCGATITGGYHSPGYPNLGMPDRAVCVDHVKIFSASRASSSTTEGE